MGDEDDGGVQLAEVSLQPLERGDVEVVGRLVEEQQVGSARQGTGERGACQLAAREGRERTPCRLGAEAEAGQHGENPLAPAIASAGLETELRGGVGPHRLLDGLGRTGHLLLQARQLRLGVQHVGAAGEDILAERNVGVERRALVVQRHPRPFLQDETARVGRELPGQDPQQGRLAGAVASRKGHPLARLELEGDIGEERLAADVDVQGGCGGDRHGATDITSSPAAIVA
jgi:hypothetical protein